MVQCSACRSSLRPGVRFCTQCGVPFSAPPSAPPPSASANPLDDLWPLGAAPAPSEPTPAREAAVGVGGVTDAPSAAVEDRAATVMVDVAPLTPPLESLRRPRERAGRPMLERSQAATWAFVTGLAPFVVSVVGNLIGADVSARMAAGTGSLAASLLVFTVVFVLNASLLTVCGITGGRGVRETANGYTRGRGLAIAGLTLGGINVVLWVAGMIVSVTALAPFLL